MYRITCLIIGYMFGCFQTAFFIGKIFFKVDVREFGSKNSGATNAVRVLGKKIGLLVFSLDILKAVLAYYICSLMLAGSGTFYDAGHGNYLPGMYAGVGVILGHNFPFYLKFKGGKGSASGIGVVLSLNLTVAIISYISGFITVGLTRYISLASMVVTFFFFVVTLVFKYNIEVSAIALFMLLLSVYQHRSNIQRIFNKSENKFSLNGKKIINEKKKEV